MRSSGDVSSITPTTLGLSNVANTRPSDLPISNAVSSAMTLKLIYRVLTLLEILRE